MSDSGSFDCFVSFEEEYEFETPLVSETRLGEDFQHSEIQDLRCEFANAIAQ